MSTFADLTDTDPVMFEAEQALLLLLGAMLHTERALKACDHPIVRQELDYAVAAIDLAQGRLGNAQGCQVKRVDEEDPEDW